MNIKNNARYITGWILTVLLGALFLFSAVMKFMGPEEVVEGFQKMGLTEWTYVIAFGELFSALLFLFPRTFVMGLLLLSSYMGGAILAHMSNAEPILFPSIILVLVWITALLRVPTLFNSNIIISKK